MKEICDRWQERLRLGHWRINIEWGRYYEVHEFGIAHSRFSLNNLEAKIVVRCPEDWAPGGFDTDYNLEATVIHELLHLKLAPLNPQSGIELEQIIETLAHSFLENEKTNL